MEESQKEMLNQNLKLNIQNIYIQYKLEFITWNNMITHRGINFNPTKDMNIETKTHNYEL